MENKEYKMRKLKTRDIFKMSRILSKIQIDFKEIKTEGMSEQQAGMALIKLVFENLHYAEAEVNEFVGDLVGLTGEEFEDLDIEYAIEIMKEFKNIKGLDVFFKSAKAQTEKK